MPTRNGSDTKALQDYAQHFRIFTASQEGFRPFIEPLLRMLQVGGRGYKVKALAWATLNVNISKCALTGALEVFQSHGYKAVKVARCRAWGPRVAKLLAEVTRQYWSLYEEDSAFGAHWDAYSCRWEGASEANPWLRSYAQQVAQGARWGFALDLDGLRRLTTATTDRVPLDFKPPRRLLAAPDEDVTIATDSLCSLRVIHAALRRPHTLGGPPCA